jgi:hypothetical protein
MAMPRNNAYLVEYDPFILKAYTAAETEEMFGDGTLEEDGVHVPPELLERYRKAWDEFTAVQHELRKIRKESRNG